MNDLFLEKVEDFTALYVYLLEHFKAIEQILRVCSKEKDVQQKTLDKYCRDGYFALQEANEDKIGAEKMRLRRRTREEIGEE
jgi:RecB family endonuclease NucS